MVGDFEAAFEGDFGASFDCLALLAFFPILTTILLPFLAAAGGRPRLAGTFFSGLVTTGLAGPGTIAPMLVYYKGLISFRSIAKINLQRHYIVS